MLKYAFSFIDACAINADKRTLNIVSTIFDEYKNINYFLWIKLYRIDI